MSALLKTNINKIKWRQISPGDLCLLCSILCLLCTSRLLAQWTWIHGDQSNAIAVYGTMGIAAPGNKPGETYATPRWNDAQGNIWIFSGAGPAILNNNIWKYNTGTNTWTWIRGNGNSNGTINYGVQGVPSTLNDPGGCQLQGTTWTDLNGDLWLLGGAVSTGGNDCLWRYTISTNEWTWMNGSQTGFSAVFGTLNVPSVTNSPGFMNEHTVTWTDASGNLWLLCGPFTSAAWMYNMSIHQWVWKGGPNTYSPPVYGTKGVAAASNTPGARYCYGSWLDAAGNCYFYGGLNGASLSGTDTYNDLWKYDPVTNLFTWVSGNNVPNTNGNYGTKCIPSVNNYPSARYENRAVTKDHCGNFWMFSGVGGSVGNNANDLWKYKPSTNEWTWVSGSQSLNSGSYGTLGIPSASNIPPTIFGGVAGFNKGLIFGLGLAVPGSNALWRYDPPPVAAFSPLISAASCAIQFTDQSTPECGGDLQSWRWDFGDGTISTLQNPSHQYNSSGNFNVTLIVTNCLDITDTIQHSVQATAPFTSSITSTSSACTSASGTATVTVSPSGNYTYSWSPVGGNSSIASNLGPGTYIVHITDATSGCGRTDSVIIVPMATVSLSSSFVNPSCTNPGTATVIPSGGTAPYTYLWNNAQTTQTATGLSNGVYSCVVTDANGCSGTTSVTLSNSNMPVVNFNYTPPLCYGSGNGAVSAVVSGGTSPYSYLWSTTQTTAGITNVAAGSYNLTVTDANGCTTTATATVVQPAKLNLTPTVVGTSCGLNNGSAIIAVAGGTAAYSYLWNPGSLTTNSINSLPAGTYTVVVSDVHSCKDSVAVNISSSNGTKASFNYSTNKGCAPACIKFNNTSVPTGTSSSWNFGDGAVSSLNPVVHCYNSPGIYTVSLTTVSQGCSDVLTLNNLIQISAVPRSAFTYLTYGGGDFDFIDQSIGAAQWLWSFGDNTSSNLQNPSHSYSTEQENIHNLVSLVVWDATGLCKDSSSLLIDIHDFTLFVPNTISPNNDGLNDVFSPKGTGIKSMEFSVYDRWGLLLFKGDSLNSGWDGTFKGEKVQEDTYVYILIATDYSGRQQRKSGILNVIR